MDIILGLVVIICMKLIYPVGIMLGFDKKEVGDIRNKKFYITSIFIILLSLFIEFLSVFFGVTLKTFLLIEIIQVMIVSFITVIYRDITNKRFEWFQYSAVLAPAVLIPLFINTDVNNDRVYLLFVAWIIGSLFSVLYPVVACSTVNFRSDRKEYIMSEREIAYYENKKQQEMEDNEIYRQFLKSSYKEIMELKNAVEKNIMTDGLVNDALERIKKYSAKEYCINSVVNETIREMERRCDYSGIEFNIDINISNVINLDDITLCSIMTNLLNNAYQYCLEYKKIGDINPYIKLFMKQQHDYVSVKVSNIYVGNIKGSKERKNTRMREHGWGQSILSDIASKHDGSFKINKDENEYTASLVVRC